jgi:hypothetical protein
VCRMGVAGEHAVAPGQRVMRYTNWCTHCFCSWQRRQLQKP